MQSNIYEGIKNAHIQKLVFGKTILSLCNLKISCQYSTVFEHEHVHEDALRKATVSKQKYVLKPISGNPETSYCWKLTKHTSNFCLKVVFFCFPEHPPFATARDSILG